MSGPFTTGEKLSIAEASEVAKVPFTKGQLIIEDSGNVFYDPTTGFGQDDRVQCGGGTFSNSNPTTSDLGGISKGTTFDDVPVTDVLNMLLYPQVDAVLSKPVLSYTPKGTQEKGVPINFTKISFTITKGSANIIKISIYDITEEVLMYTSDPDELETLNNTGSITITHNFTAYSITSGKSHSYRVTIEDADNKSYTQTVQVSPSWVYPYYYGVVGANKTSLTQNEIKAITKLVAAKGTQALNFDLNKQKVVFCYPASYGALSVIEDQNHFDATDLFGLSTVSVTANDGESVSYYVYLQHRAATNDDFRFTFIF